jgi:signal transduction histidine kinase
MQPKEEKIYLMHDAPSTILVVDDTHENLRLLSGILKEQGYSVRLAPSGSLAIESALTTPPDLILLDIMMPSVDGYEVCRRLKADSRTSSIPIIFLSALNEPLDKVKAFALGGVDFITKPFHVEEVLVRISTHLSLQHMQRQLETHNTQLEARVHERTEALSVATAELERTARLKNEFLANISHEFRTPLNAILGMSEALSLGSYGSLEEQQKEMLSVITQSGHRLLALINNLLDFSHIESGNVTLTLAPCQISSICQSSMQNSTQEIAHKQLEARLDIDEMLPILVADERKVKQSIKRLLDNAIKFTPEGGTIGIKAMGKPQQQRVEVSVWDTGNGIAQEHIPRLFRPFVQGDGSLARTHSGVGLGLILAYRLVDMHGGSMTLETTVGKGSSFTVALPWIEPSPESWSQLDGLSTPSNSNDTPEYPAPPPPANAPLILLVDDNERTIQQLCHTDSLCQHYRFVVARSGVEAIARLKDDQPDLIIADVYIHDMEGSELIRLVRSHTHSATLPIIATSTLVLPGDQQRYAEMNLAAYLVKPLDVTAMQMRIEQLLAR